jgi:hypothetical protein
MSDTTSAASQKIACKLQLCDTIIHGGARKLAMPFRGTTYDFCQSLTDWWPSGIGSSTYHALVYSGHTHTILGRTKSFPD